MNDFEELVGRFNTLIEQVSKGLDKGELVADNERLIENNKQLSELVNDLDQQVVNLQASLIRHNITFEE